MINSGFKFFMAFSLAVSIAACAASTRGPSPSVRQHIAESYGFPYFGGVEKLQYAFNIRKGEEQTSRFWIWEPRLNRVTFKTMDYQKAVTYNRGEITDATSDRLKNIDAWFINDNYWLLFPFHLVWDSNAKVEDIGRQKLPLGDGSARCVVVSYPASGNPPAGDVYDLYLDDQYRLIQWIYRRGGAKQPTRITTWDDYRKVGPLTLSLDHRGADHDFRVWFTNVGVKMAGLDNWLFAQ